MVVWLENDKLRSIQFRGGHPPLQDGVKMGMKMEEIKVLAKGQRGFYTAYLYFFFLIYPRFPFLIYSAGDVILPLVTNLKPMRALRSLVWVDLFAIWFYLLCPSLLSVSFALKTPHRFRLKSYLSSFNEKNSKNFIER